MEQDAGISSLPLFISNFVSFRVLTIRGMCPADRRQWADFLVFLTSPLHRQYKTARTETRRHLLLKTWQMPTQTSASRGYVLFIGDVRNTQKSLNCLSACGHIPRIVKTRKDAELDIKSGREEILAFCSNECLAPAFPWNIRFSIIIAKPSSLSPCAPASYHRRRYSLACPVFLR